jgi:hypothetical protein
MRLVYAHLGLPSSSRFLELALADERASRSVCELGSTTHPLFANLWIGARWGTHPGRIVLILRVA